MGPRDIAGLFRDAGRGWLDDEAPSMGAALAFYTLFSMAPLLLLVISVAGMVIGEDVARGLLSKQLVALLGDAGAAAVQSVLAAASNREEGLVAAAVSFAILMLGATTVFAELRRDLDRIWRYKAPKTQAGIWSLVGARLWSFGLVLTIGFLLMVSLALSATVAAVGALWSADVPGSALVLRSLEFLTSVAVITGLFAMIFKILPSARPPWRDVWAGAAMTSLLFWLGKWLIGIYLAESAVASPFGAAGTLVVVIVWVYYSAQIFFFGAELTRAYSLRRGMLREAPREGGAAAAPAPA